MKTLESYKAFSYVAWTLIVLFSLFTYGLARNLEKSAEYLDSAARPVTLQNGTPRE